MIFKKVNLKHKEIIFYISCNKYNAIYHINHSLNRIMKKQQTAAKFHE